MLSDLLQKSTLLTDFDFMYINEIPENRQEGINKLVEFAFQKKEIPRKLESSSVKLIDFEIDAELIYSAFMEKYQIDLLNPDLHLHWYKFEALLNGLSNCKLTEVIGFRAYEPNNNSDYKKDMLKNKRAWELPTELTQEEKEALELFDSKFK